jgi:hypothetical protein
MSTQEKERGIRTSDFRFMMRGPNGLIQNLFLDLKLKLKGRKLTF